MSSISIETHVHSFSKCPRLSSSASFLRFEDLQFEAFLSNNDHSSVLKNVETLIVLASSEMLDAKNMEQFSTFIAQNFTSLNYLKIVCQMKKFSFEKWDDLSVDLFKKIPPTVKGDILLENNVSIYPGYMSQQEIVTGAQSKKWDLKRNSNGVLALKELTIHPGLTFTVDIHNL